MAVLLAAIVVVHAGALLLYRQSAVAAADEAFAQQVATQIALAREGLTRRQPAERETEARALSAPHFEIGWSKTSPIITQERSDPVLWSLRSRILELQPSLGTSLVLAMGDREDALHAEDLSGALALPDGGFLTFRSAHAPNFARLGAWAFVSTAMAILVGLAAVLLVHRIAKPLRNLTQATEAIGNGPLVTVPEAGPDETRGIARALNAMQHRIHGLVTERTQALAAVSHDLRTPIARLRLRLERMADTHEGRAMSADLDEMQAMIESTLAYLRGDSDPEPRQVVNIASLAMSVSDSAADAGRPVTYDGPGRALSEIRPITLRRALENLVDNAVRYGHRAGMILEVHTDAIVLRIEDDGPGIAPEKVESAFAPFTRLEASRNRHTGGTGLGLTIARRAIEAEGGSITLTNRAEGGLCAELVLPRAHTKPR